MKIIRTQLHGLADYGFIVILMLPWITNYATREKDTIAFASVGFFIFTLSLITDYEWRLIKLIPMRIHLFIDILVNIFLMAMPLIFPLTDYYLYWPVILGACGLVITILSSPKPYMQRQEDIDITKPYH